MAYSTSNPPSLVSQTIGGGPKVWVYTSTDAVADVDAAGYFSNGEALGMAVGDVVNVVDTTNTLVTPCHVTAVSTTATVVAFIVV